MSFLGVPTLQRLTHSLTHHSLNCPSLTQARMCLEGDALPQDSWSQLSLGKMWPLCLVPPPPQLDQEGLVEAGRLN